MVEWTNERIVTLQKLWAEVPELSALDIGLQMGISKNSVIGKARRLKLKPRPSPIQVPGYIPPRVANALKHRRDRVVPAPIGATLAVLPSMGNAKGAAPELPKVSHVVGPTRTCQFIAGNPPWRRLNLFCEIPSYKASSWCEEHHLIVFRGETP